VGKQLRSCHLNVTGTCRDILAARLITASPKAKSALHRVFTTLLTCTVRSDVKGGCKGACTSGPYLARPNPLSALVASLGEAAKKGWRHAPIQMPRRPTSSIVLRWQIEGNWSPARRGTYSSKFYLLKSNQSPNPPLPPSHPPSQQTAPHASSPPRRRKARHISGVDWTLPLWHWCAFPTLIEPSPCCCLSCALYAATTWRTSAGNRCH